MLKFSVRHQSLTRTDRFYPVEKSLNYLKASFQFCTAEWEQLEKKAICRNLKADTAYDARITEGACLIPWEALAEDGEFEISVQGTGAGVTVTTSVVLVILGRTLAGAAESDPPSPTELEWLRQEIRDMEKRLGILETGGANQEAIADAVEAYLEENPPAGITTVTINGEAPDEGGNFSVNTLTDEQIEELSDLLE